MSTYRVIRQSDTLVFNVLLFAKRSVLVPVPKLEGLVMADNNNLS